MAQAFARALERCGDASTLAFFASPANVSAALRGESLLAQHDDSFVITWEEVRTSLAYDLERAGALWFSVDPERTLPSRVSLCGVEAIAWLSAGQEQSETVIFNVLPATIAYLLPDLLTFCTKTLQSDYLEILLESPTFRRSFSNRERQWLLATAATSLGADCSADIVNILVAHGAKLDVEDPNEMLPTPQLGACAEYGATALACLVANGVTTVGVQHALSVLVRSGTKTTGDQVRSLVRYGVDVNASARDGTTALHEAAREKNALGVRALFQDGFADLDARDNDGATPLMRAVYSRNDPIRIWQCRDLAAVKELLALGAHVDARGNDGSTALHLARLSRSFEVFQLLLAHVADPNLADGLGCTALHRVGAYDAHAFEATRLLLERHVDVNARNHRGETPLLTTLHTYVSEQSHPSQLVTIALMLKHGADPNIPDHNGVTPLGSCLSLGRPHDPRLSSLLTHYGAMDPNATVT